MTSVFETLMEQTFGLFVENICSEAIATNVCDMFGAWWEPLVETICGVLGGGK
jgi:hypothetical protein